ncbi:MAG: hypothetical protein WAM09_05385 [Anaerolineales bacterium]
MKSHIWLGLFSIYMQRQQELLKEAEQYRLVNEARAGIARTRRASKFLALIGKELTRLGVSLEKRFGIQSEIGTSFDQQSNPGGCT